jgi:hypothetical protein
MQSISLIHGCKPLSGKVEITNEVGSRADVLAVVKRASAKVIKLTSAVEAELELAA